MSNCDEFHPQRGKIKALSNVPCQALSCFRITSHHKKKRAKFEAQRRNEVATVRKRGACLRCRLLKRTCDGEDPCRRCLALAEIALKTNERRVLQFSDCIRTSMKSISIFEHALPPADAYPAILAASDQITINVTLFSFETAPKYQPEVLVHKFVTWFDRDYRNSNALIKSATNTHSIPFLALVAPVTGLETAKHFQRFLFADCFVSARRRTHGETSLPDPQLGKQIEAIAGHHCLLYFDRKLTPQALSRCSLNDICVLMFLLLMTISGTSCSYPVTDFRTFPSSENETRTHNRPYTLFDAMQKHLCRTLGHYMIYLASHSPNLFTQSAERDIIDSTPWHWSMGRFWTYADENERTRLATLSSPYPGLNLEVRRNETGVVELEQGRISEMDPDPWDLD